MAYVQTYECIHSVYFFFFFIKRSPVSRPYNQCYGCCWNTQISFARLTFWEKRSEDRCVGFLVLRMCFLGWLRGWHCLVSFFAYRNLQTSRNSHHTWDLQLPRRPEVENVDFHSFLTDMVNVEEADVVKDFSARSPHSAICSGLASVIWSQKK